MVLVSCVYDVYGQRTCKVRSNGSSGAVDRSSSVFIQITDETHGKVVTYQKEFKLDHIPPSQREQYVDNLIDELTGFSEDDRLWIDSNPKSPKNKVIERKRYTYAPSRRK